MHVPICIQSRAAMVRISAYQSGTCTNLIFSNSTLAAPSFECKVVHIQPAPNRVAALEIKFN